jgi:CubicO group peptidase (beta-lactamase class C family)
MIKITRLIILFTAFVMMQGCYATRAFNNRKFELRNLDRFDSAPLPAASAPFHFVSNAANYHRLSQYLDTNLANSDTYAFLVIRNDSIIYERYFGDISPSTKLPSFSVAKSFISTLIGMALEEGKIKGLDEPITNYLPELEKRDERFRRINIQNLLDMRSGVKSSEQYANPFSDVLKLGFTKNIRAKTLRVKYGKAPGGDFEYRSVNTQLLAMILEKATGKPLQDYMNQKLWIPLGMQYDASWNIDSRKTQKVRAFCCINAAALDFAKFGQLFLHQGNWNGKQLISKEWVERSTSLDTMRQYNGYKNQWWSGWSRNFFRDSSEAAAFAAKNLFKPLLSANTRNKDGVKYYQVMYRDAFHADGILGQMVYVNPAKNLVIVRLGHYWKHHDFNDVEPFVYSLGAAF